MTSGGEGSLTKGVGNLSLEDTVIKVNYDEEWVYGELPRQTTVESILASTPVVLFGEGNVTFSFALAAIQGGWSRITSTRFDKNKSLPDFNSVQQACVKNCADNGKQLKVTPDDIIEKIKIIMSLTAPVFALCGIDPTRRAYIVEGKVAWFQCPWISLTVGTYATEPLITAFLKTMAKQQKPGDYVLIGITTKFPYVKSYNLGKLLDFSLPGSNSRYKRASKKCSTCPSYTFIGADDTFINKMLQFGYHHECVDGTSDIHEEIIEDHITLIFRRND